MTTKPFYNAIAAILYILLVVSVINMGSHFAPAKDNILMPIGMLSLFVLSASIMAYIFLYNPIVMFLDGNRKDALRLFFQSLCIFAGFTFALLLLSIIIRF